MAQENDSSKEAGGGASIKTLLLTDLVDSTKLLEHLGDMRAAEVFAHHDRISRDLLVEHGGQEIDKTDGFLFLFQRPIAAARYALAYHEATRELTAEYEVRLAARAGIHLGEVVLHENDPDDVARGAKPLEVEGLAKHTVARVMSLAEGGQTLMSETAFLFAQRASVGTTDLPPGTQFVRHGLYQLKGVEEPVAVGEIGVEGQAPLTPPGDSEKAWRASLSGGIELDAKRPAAGRRNNALAGAVGLVVVGGLVAIWLARPDDGLSERPAPTPPRVAEPVEPPAAPPAASPPPPAEPPPAPAQLKLRLESDPPGAAIQLDGASMGSTPLSLSLPALAAAYQLQATLPGQPPRTLRCVVSAEDVARGESLCRLDVKPRPAARRAPRRKSEAPAKPKAGDADSKPTVHMID